MGDTVTKADGKTFTSSEDFMKYVKSQKVGQEMKVTYTHDGETKEATEKLIKLPTDKKPGIGITLTDHTEIDSQEKVKVDAGDIGGPSAGLMFTLEIYEQLVDKDLRQGKKIAGTGTINSEEKLVESVVSIKKLLVPLPATIKYFLHLMMRSPKR